MGIAVSVQPKSRREVSMRQLLGDEYLRNRSHGVDGLRPCSVGNGRAPLTHPDQASLVDPLCGKPQRG